MALGDAVCAFNPYYGQGMAVAASSAVMLGALLAGRGPGAGFAAAYQRRLARLLATPWLMATTEECRYPGTDGARFGWRTRLNLWYTDRLLTRAAHDPEVMRAFVAVSQLTEPFAAIVRPRILAAGAPAAEGLRGGSPPPRTATRPSDRGGARSGSGRTGAPKMLRRPRAAQAG